MKGLLVTMLATLTMAMISADVFAQGCPTCVVRRPAVFQRSFATYQPAYVEQHAQAYAGPVIVHRTRTPWFQQRRMQRQAYSSYSDYSSYSANSNGGVGSYSSNGGVGTYQPAQPANIEQKVDGKAPAAEIEDSGAFKGSKLFDNKHVESALTPEQENLIERLETQARIIRLLKQELDEAKTHRVGPERAFQEVMHFPDASQMHYPDSKPQELYARR